MKYNIGKTAIFVASGIFLSATFGLLLYKQNSTLPSTVEPDKNIATYQDKLIDFPNDITESITYSDSKNEIHYALKDNQDNYIDADILLNKTSGFIIASLSGLKTTTKISLMLDNVSYHNAVPVDWAGHLVLDADNIDFEKTQLLCLSFENSNFPQNPKICHNLQATETGGVPS